MALSIKRPGTSIQEGTQYEARGTILTYPKDESLISTLDLVGKSDFSDEYLEVEIVPEDRIVKVSTGLSGIEFTGTGIPNVISEIFSGSVVQFSPVIPRKRYAKSVLKEMAIEKTGELIKLIETRQLGVVDLSFAAEALGYAPLDTTRVLTPLLNHKEAIVREGAIYGIAGQINLETRDWLARLAEKDPSAAVREAAAEALA